MDNKQIARILRETASLLQIDGAIIGRYRSYEKAAELIDSLPESVEQLVATPEKLTELPGIGDRMVEHLEEIVKTGDYSLRKKLLKKYPETILQLLDLQSLGPKKVAFLWKEFKAGSVADVEKLAKETEFAAGYDRVRTPHLAGAPDQVHHTDRRGVMLGLPGHTGARVRRCADRAHRVDRRRTRRP